MNDVNIYQEFLIIMNNRNITNIDLAKTCSVSRQTTYDWMSTRHIPDKYLDLIANTYRDPYFTYAVFGYKHNFPFIDFRKRYNFDSLSMLIGCVKEDRESDEAVQDLQIILSKPDGLSNIKQLSKDTKEMYETGILFLLTSISTCYKAGLTPKQALLEGRQ